jgi:hypothetical protein
MASLHVEDAVREAVDGSATKQHHPDQLGSSAHRARHLRVHLSERSAAQVEIGQVQDDMEQSER